MLNEHLILGWRRRTEQLRRGSGEILCSPTISFQLLYQVMHGDGTCDLANASSVKTEFADAALRLVHFNKYCGHRKDDMSTWSSADTHENKDTLLPEGIRELFGAFRAHFLFSLMTLRIDRSIVREIHAYLG
jgi:hypothetical protein